MDSSVDSVVGARLGIVHAAAGLEPGEKGRGHRARDRQQIPALRQTGACTVAHISLAELTARGLPNWICMTPKCTSMVGS